MFATVHLSTGPRFFAWPPVLLMTDELQAVTSRAAHSRPAGHQRWAFCAIAGGLVFAFALTSHPRLVAGGEYDQYLQIAEDLGRGIVRDDAFHPLLYPELTAVAGLLLGAFAGGKFVSAIAFAALLASVHRLLAVRLGNAQAWLPTLAIGIQPPLFLLGPQVASDMLGTALIVAGYGWALAGSGPRKWFWAGVAFGAAVATRQNLLVHVPCLLVLSMLEPGRMRRGLVVLGGLLLGVLPHVVPRLWCFGSAFGSRNWQNIVLKYQLDYDMQALVDLPEGAAAAMLREHWWQWAQRGVLDCIDWWVRGMPEQLLGAAVRSPMAAWSTSLVISAAVLVAIVRRQRSAALLFVAAIVHAGSVCLVFRPEPRVMMPSLVALAVATMLVAAHWGRRGAAVAATLWLIAGLAQVPSALAAFRALHHEAEVAVAQQLVRERGELTQLAGTYPFLDREVQCLSVTMIHPFGGRRDVAAAELWQRLEAVRRVRPASLFVIGRVGRLFDLACDADLPPQWRRLRRDDDVVVLERLPDHPLQLRMAAAVWRTGPLHLEVGAGDGGPDPAWLGVVLVGPGNVELRLPFVREPGRAPVLQLPAGQLATGEWRLVPLALQRDGTIQKGEEHRLVVE